MPFPDLARVTVTVSIVTFWMAGCGGATAPDIPESPESIARQAAAEFLSIPADDVSLVSITPREFNDSSLDCPEPGMSYLQAITAGHRVIVEADGRRFDVRVSGGHGRICRRNKTNAAAASAATRPDVAELIDLAREDLARHLETDSSNVRFLEVKPLKAQEVTTACSIDCGESSTQCGYMIALVYDGRRYDYHANEGADETKVAPCPPISAM